MAKCSECGFLAYRLKDTWGFTEATPRMRSGQTANTGTGYMPLPLHIFRLPICFESVVDFSSVIPNHWGEDPEHDKDVFIEIGRKRECSSFTTWKPGFSPKEHREMLDRQWMRDQEQKRIDDDRAWRASMRREERWWRLVELLVLGGFVSAATLLAGAVGRGWEPNWWPL